MPRFIAIFFLLLLVAGCSDKNDGAPSVNEPHPEGWILTHPQEARQDLQSCRACHGENFQGIGDVIGCTACHFGGIDQTTGNFTVHPPSWGSSIVLNHQEFPSDFSWTSCAVAACHGADLHGGTLGTDCFQCHPGGIPAPENHSVAQGLFFVQPDQHGNLAQNNLFYCRNCHGRPPYSFDGGLVADPQINNYAPVGACTTCHPDAKAHPSDWVQSQGTPVSPGDLAPTYFAHHRDVQNWADLATGCVLCHAVTAGASSPLSAAPSCFTAQFTGADGSTTGCHSGGPGSAPHALPFTSPADHGPVAKQDLAFCQECHGTPGTTQFQGGSVSTACATCHPAAMAHPTNWQGTNDPSAGYLSSHRTAGSLDTACAVCHQVTQQGTAPLAQAPSCFSATFTNSDGSTTGCHPGGPGIAHPLGQPWLDKNSATFHGDSTLDCTPCHGADLQGGTANVSCFTCHFSATGSRVPPNTNWTHGQNNHQTFSQFEAVCNNCHNTNREYGNPPENCHNCH